VHSVKDITIKPISSKDASRVIARWHYSGRSVQNSQIHFGAFLGGQCHGAMQFGPSLDKRKIAPLVRGTGWNNFIELNRLAFGEALPKNSESRCLAISFRLFKKHYPHIKWIVSFADATQCGDGAIYRASGFVLTSIRTSKNLGRLPDGTVIHKMTLESNPNKPRNELKGKSYFQATGGKYDFKSYLKQVGGVVVPGFQLRYIRFLDPAWRERLTVPEVPFSRISEMGATMRRGERVRSETSDTSSDQFEEGGATPTRTLPE
tara:strand:+ start:364 stop:1149 length:786 start_codon:yes stop_codon:yes gene_type:complete